MTNIYRLTDEWSVLLGEQIKRLRISNDMDQAQLAGAANISIGAVKSLESGKGSSIKTLVKVVRVLHSEAWLESLSPESVVSPLQILRDQHISAPRRRVYRKRAKNV